MSRRYRLSAPAQLDAEELFDFIAARDFDRAIRIERELFDTLTLLATRPLIGHSRADLDVPPRLRVWPFYSWLIIYDPKTRPIEIVRIWHGAQRKPKL